MAAISVGGSQSASKAAATVGGVANAYTFRIYATLNRQSVAENRSYLTIKQQIKCANNWGWEGFTTPKAVLKYTKADGSTGQLLSTVMKNVSTTKAGTWQTISSIDAYFTHASNGTMSVTLTMSYTPGTSSYSYLAKATTVTLKLTLPQINRAAVWGTLPTSIDVDASSISLPVTRYTSSLTTKLGITLLKSDGSTYQTIRSATAWTGSTTSFSASEKLAIYKAMSTRSSTTIRFHLSTWNGSTQIGSTQIKTSTIKILNANPEVLGYTLSLDQRTKDLTGSEDTVIKSYSSVSVDTIDTDFSGAKEATLKNYKVNSTTVTSLPHPLTNYDKDNVVLYVVDTRGNSGSKTHTFENFINYSKPVDKSILFTRPQGQASPTVSFAMEGSYWKESFGLVPNSLQITKIRYKDTESDEWIEVPEAIDNFTIDEDSSGNFTISDQGALSVFNPLLIYDFELTVADELDTTTFTTKVGTGVPAIAVYKNYAALHGAYDKELGGTQIYGDLYLNGSASLNGKAIETVKEQKALWTGIYYMTDTQTVELSETVLEQKNGIVLEFSGYSGGYAQNYNWTCVFIPKRWVQNRAGAGYFVSLGGTDGICSYKYLYIHNDKIVGHANNKGSITKSGVTYNNSLMVLRSVYGV